MFIDLPAIYPCARYPLTVLGKDAGDLVDIHFGSSGSLPEHVDLMGYRECLLADHERIKVFCRCGTVLVMQGLYLVSCRKSTTPDVVFKYRPPDGVLPDRVALSPGKLVGGEADGHLSARSCKFERTADQPLVAIVEGIKGTPDHNLHCAR